MPIIHVHTLHCRSPDARHLNFPDESRSQLDVVEFNCTVIVTSGELVSESVQVITPGASHPMGGYALNL